ncbi:MAG: hypothetical protein A2452_08955 [Candidatus Firestonebacteria bacterium RIFOXYC2_FULL_39_67]|nr:MAG: hypothetical protein A2536_09545 [Candidatus Firestonebacteria bacterium RIFOXYD2_FULL_39_29]OGF53578.1 MAG: hypothetical protein A2452_08955 [Candidatus Firestonebacteria bacterium RIFOXYC2_FULL_39_67]
MYLTLIRFLKRYIYFSEEIYYHILACIIILSYIYRHFESVCILWLVGAEGSGKTRILDCLNVLVKSPLRMSETTSRSLIREISRSKGFVLVDESDFMETADMKRILRVAYKRGGVIKVCDRRDQRKSITYVVYVLIAAGGPNRPSEKPLTSRCIIVAVIKKPKDIKLEKFIERIARGEAAPIKAEIKQFIDKIRPDVLREYPTFDVSSLIQEDNRHTEVWEGPIMMAMHVDKEFPGMEIAQKITEFAKKYVTDYEANRRTTDVEGNLAFVILKYVERTKSDKGDNLYREDNLLSYLKQGTDEFAWISSKGLRQILNSIGVINNAPRETFYELINKINVKVWRVCFNFNLEKLKAFVKSRLGDEGGQNGESGPAAEIPRETI